MLVEVLNHRMFSKRNWRMNPDFFLSISFRFFLLFAEGPEGSCLKRTLPNTVAEVKEKDNKLCIRDVHIRTYITHDIVCVYMHTQKLMYTHTHTHTPGLHLEKWARGGKTVLTRNMRRQRECAR